MLRRTFLAVAAAATTSAMAMFNNSVKFHRRTIETNVLATDYGPEFTTFKEGKDSYFVPLFHSSEQEYEDLIIDMHISTKKEYPDTKEFWTYTILNSDGRVGFITSNLELKQV